MPRLISAREYVEVNYYDGVNIDTDLVPNGSTRMFGNRYIGMRELTNMNVAGMIPGGSNWMIRNWYARTNITEATPEFAAFVEATRLTLRLGNRAFWDLPLSDLLRRRDQPETPPNEEEQRALAKAFDDRVSALAAELRHYYHGHDTGTPSDSPAAAEWRQVAKAAIDRLEPRPYLVLLERQDFGVHVESDPDVTRALSLASRLSRIRQRWPTPPRFWVHLQGWIWRDLQ